MQKQIERFDCRNSVLSATQEAINSIEKEICSLHDSQAQKTLEKYGFNVINMIQDLNEFKEDIFQLKKLYQVRMERFENKLQVNRGYNEMNHDFDSIQNEIRDMIENHILLGQERAIFFDKAKDFATKKIRENVDFHVHVDELYQRIETINENYHLDNRRKNEYIDLISDVIKAISPDDYSPKKV
jgi:hypothetical protein